MEEALTDPFFALCPRYYDTFVPFLLEACTDANADVRQVCSPAPLRQLLLCVVDSSIKFIALQLWPLLMFCSCVTGIGLRDWSMCGIWRCEIQSPSKRSVECKHTELLKVCRCWLTAA